MEYKVLTNGIKMPMEGFGVFQVRDKEECKESVLNAIRAGYRLIDTAASYTNEDAVGEAVREAIAEGICTRKELFITSKMWVQDMQNYEMAKKAIDHSIETLGVEYLDLYLLHQAMMACYGGCVQRRKVKSHRCFQFLSSCAGQLLRNSSNPSYGKSD